MKIIIYFVNSVTAIILGILAIWIEPALGKFIPNWFSLAATVGITVCIVVVIGLGAWWSIRRLSSGTSLRGLLSFVLPLLLVVILLMLIRPPPPPPPITITITNIPPVGFGQNDQAEIGGEVKGLPDSSAYTNYQVVIYSFVKMPPGRNPWQVEPYVAVPITHIGDNGSWGSLIYLGSKYAALLVTNGYVPESSLPKLPVPGRGVIAVTSVEGKRR